MSALRLASRGSAIPVVDGGRVERERWNANRNAAQPLLDDEPGESVLHPLDVRRHQQETAGEDAGPAVHDMAAVAGEVP